jgi:hypothetical protein
MQFAGFKSLPRLQQLIIVRALSQPLMLLCIVQYINMPIQIAIENYPFYTHPSRVTDTKVLETKLLFLNILCRYFSRLYFEQDVEAKMYLILDT